MGEVLERDGEGPGEVAEGGGSEDCTSGWQERQIQEDERQRLWTRSLHILHEIWSDGSLFSWKPRLQVLQSCFRFGPEGFFLGALLLPMPRAALSGCEERGAGAETGWATAAVSSSLADLSLSDSAGRGLVSDKESSLTASSKLTLATVYPSFSVTILLVALSALRLMAPICCR